MPPRKPPTRAKAAGEPSKAAPAAEPEVEEVSETAEEIADAARETEAELTPSRKAAKDKREREVLDVAAAATVDAAINDLAALRLKLDGALEGISVSLIERAKRLATLDEAVAVKRAQIAELHKVEVVADTLSALLAQWERTKREIEEQGAAARAAIEKELAERRAAFEAEQARFLEAASIEKAQVKRDWQREQEEYAYTQKTGRARDEEDYQAKRRALLAMLAEEKARQELSLAEREGAVGAREQELEALRGRVAGLDVELAKAVEAARKEGAAAAELKAGHEAELKAKDAVATQKLLEQRIVSLEATLKQQVERIDDLQKEVKDATTKVRDIAVKAIEGASGATALTRVTDIAMQQAKGRTEG